MGSRWLASDGPPDGLDGRGIHPLQRSYPAKLLWRYPLEDHEDVRYPRMIELVRPAARIGRRASDRRPNSAGRPGVSL